jgi:DNA mismatch repair enzyme (predicted ATPase)
MNRRKSNQMQTVRFEKIQVSRHETVRPTPDILDALERDYPLEASIADLVDNSIDARACNVLIRFMRSQRKLVSVCIADDGCGMTDIDARRAMQFAARRPYKSTDLGMFGVGLKTASLSQAESVIIASRAHRSRAVGRRWTKSGIKKHDWRLDVLTSGSAELILEHNWGEIGAITRGTVVRWDQVYDFERLQSGVDEYLEEAKQLIRNHLGLKLHRFLARRQIRIQIDIEDITSGEVGPPSQVLPTNPFPPRNLSGAKGYPKNIIVTFPGAGKVPMRVYIWRKKSKDEGYKLGGGSVAEHQGFYFFRHDRLIQDGGWCGYVGTNEPHMSLARAEVDIPDSLASYLKVRSNKAGVDVPATFGPALREARAKDGTSFGDFLAKAEQVYRRRGEQKPRPMLAPGSGIPAEVRDILQRREMRFLRGQKCSISWEKLRGPGFIHVDQEDRRIILNERYRKMLLRGAHGGKTDLPLLRTLLYFVFEGLLAGDRIGPVERFRLEAVQSSMSVALKLEEQWAKN